MVWQVPTPSSPYSALGIFIFAGGFSIGMADHFKVLGHLEDGLFGTATAKKNFPRMPIWVHPDRWPRDKFRDGGVDVIFGNPPCSCWSPIGSSMRYGSDNWRRDPNLDYSKRLIEYGLDIKPTIWCMESVPQIQKSEFLLDMGQMWMEAGYAFTLVRIDGKFLGLPQQRRRCFMVAHKVEIPWQIYPGDHKTTPYTAGECLETAPAVGVHPPIAPYHQDLVSRTVVGTSMRAVWERDNPEYRGVDGRDVHVPGRPLLMIHRIDPTIPSGVIIGQNVYLHPFEDRYIGHLEAARLCGYPDDWQWVNGARVVQSGPNRGTQTSNDYIAQIAKAVTPPAARFLAKNLVAGLDLGIPARVRAEKATFWAPSMRVSDWRLEQYIEDWDLRHKCTVRGVEPLHTELGV